MPVYDNSNRRYNSDELDPCLAAEVRIKNDLLEIRQSKCLLFFILTLLTIMLLVAAFLILLYGVPMSAPRTHIVEHNEVLDPAPHVQIEKAAAPTVAPQVVMEQPRTKVREKFNWKSRDHSSFTFMPSTITTSEMPSLKVIEHQGSSTDKTSTTLSSTLAATTTESTSTMKTTTTAPPLSTTWYEVHMAVTEPVTAFTITYPKTTVMSTKKVEDGAMDIMSSSVHDDPTMDLVTIMGANSAADSKMEYQFIPSSESREHCGSYLQAGFTTSGVYDLFVQGIGGFRALCFMNADDGWTVLQRRTGGELPFWNATFDEYSNGFGDPRGDYWLGLEKVYAFIHRNYNVQLRIILQGDLCVAKNKCGGLGEHGFWWGDWEFAISNRADMYKLTTLKYLRGNLSDPSIDYFNMLNRGQNFTTVDSDNDANAERNVAAYLKKGGWWHKDFSFVALNGEYGFKSSAGVGQSWYWSNGKGKTYYIKPKASIMMFRLKK